MSADASTAHDGNINAGREAMECNHSRVISNGYIVVSSQFTFFLPSQTCNLFSALPSPDLFGYCQIDHDFVVSASYLNTFFQLVITL